MRGLIGFLLLAILSWGAAGASDTAKRATPSNTQVVATPLHTTSTVSFSQHDWFAWLNPARCDTDGNVFVVPVPEADPRDVKNKSAPPLYPRKLSDILRISADGRERKLFSLASVPALAKAQEISTVAMTLGPGGIPFALVWAQRGEASGSHYIVSFEESGRYRSHVEVDGDEMAVQRFEVFGTGEFLLQGVRVWGDSRVAVMPAGGGLLRDVDFLPEVDSEDAGTQPRISEHLARGGDGRIYFVPEGKESIHVIEPSGLSEHAFRLAPVPRNWRLTDLKAVGPRLALIYYEERGRETGRAWIAIYDVRDGERRTVYGPALGLPVCYQHVGQQDQFTVLKDGRYLISLSPPL